MPYVITAPNALQSPSLFPPQANTNFSRLKDIIKADHNFTDSTATSQGIHKQVTMFNRSAPTGTVTVGNGILYATQTGGQSALNWYNGTNYQIAPPTLVPGFTNVIVNTVTLASGASATIYPNPGFAYMAYVYFSQQDSSTFLNFTIANSNTNNTFRLQNIVNIPSSRALNAIYGGTNNRDLKVMNSSLNSVVCSYIVQIQQLP